MEIASSSSSLIKDPKSTQSTAAAATRSRKRRNTCIGISIAILLLLIIIIIILAFTVFKAKRPITTVNSVALADLDVSLNLAGVSVDINVTLIADIAITNPNKVGFSYKNSTAFLNYRGELVGEAPIMAGKIDAGERKEMNITLTIMADRLLKTTTVFTDAVAGSMPLNTYTRISGKVKILGIFNIHVVSSTSCDFNVDISERKIGDQQCNYHTKI
ncbi:uncharacterized protein LOC101208230 [Cucumis sativus]|uniref:Late embryogenesis abundant protein LEA-2 subgroup domain-containing protein n=1 Tax=Cucumis sativus TaxID=3659 RepID=A0A0A0L094_CUCSA|nr:uncharacterized protein LOC101208230 [Cucumis sativus]KGN54479.1 hypothetical protein Csa_012636 [Cucumis sativus]